jgi:hypothetical protein
MNFLTTPELFFFYHINLVLDLPIHICPEGATFDTRHNLWPCYISFSLIEIIINQKRNIIVNSSRINMNSIMYYMNSTTQPKQHENISFVTYVRNSYSQPY